MNKFEQLIEYVINEEDGKAEDLFHEIVVEKSRDIYESLMDSEDEFGNLLTIFQLMKKECAKMKWAWSLKWAAKSQQQRWEWATN